jgi:hypothetical protein
MNGHSDDQVGVNWAFRDLSPSIGPGQKPVVGGRTPQEPRTRGTRPAGPNLAVDQQGLSFVIFSRRNSGIWHISYQAPVSWPL